MNLARKKTARWLVSVLVIIACLFLLALPVLAGEGDGTGGGQNVPLGLDSSSPANGQSGVELQPLIKLTFNKNVINLAIRDANKKCFSLVSSAGSKVPIEVIMADDQIQPEEKRNVSLKPLQTLKPASSYTVIIAPQLQAKNGSSLGHEVTVKFTTAGTAAETPQTTPSPAKVTEQPDERQQQENVKNQAETSASQKGSGTAATDKTASEPAPKKDTSLKTATNADSEKESSTTAPMAKKQATAYTSYLIAAGVVLLAALGYVYWYKRRKK